MKGVKAPPYLSSGGDISIHWDHERPTEEQVLLVLEDYLGDKSWITQENGLYICRLPGVSTGPFSRIPNSMHRDFTERVFQVFVHKEGVSIEMWPGSDDFTAVVAEGFAELFKRMWKAKISM